MVALMVKKKPILSVNDKRIQEQIRKYAYIYFINKRFVAFDYDNKPRHGGVLWGIVDVSTKEYTGKTISEKITALNAKLVKGEKVKVIKAKLKAKPEKLPTEQITSKPAPRWELVKDWDAPRIDKRPDMSVNELEKILNAPVSDTPDLSLREWQLRHPDIVIVNHHDHVVVNTYDTSLYTLTDYAVVDVIGAGEHNVGRVMMLRRKTSGKDKTFGEIIAEENRD
jgi:hypothetical protein